VIALFDIDSLFYLCSYKLDTPESVEQLGLTNEDADTIIFQLAQKAEERLWDMVQSIMLEINEHESNIQIDSVEVYVTRCRDSIRKKISPEYKSNREPNEVVNCLRNMFIFSHDAIYHDKYEADDLIADRAKQLNHSEYIIITMDKDLKQIGGFIFNFYRKPPIRDEQGQITESFPRKGLSYTSKTEGMKFLAKQMIMGDSGDKIAGLPKYGKAKAEKIIKPINTRFGLLKAVISEYKKVYGDDYSEPLLQNFRLLYLGAY
jgi:5'-3' exonuclease